MSRDAYGCDPDLEVWNGIKCVPKSPTQEVSGFYVALGELNTSLVARIIRDPEQIKEVTDFILKTTRQFGPEDCGKKGSYWGGVQCVVPRL